MNTLPMVKALREFGQRSKVPVSSHVCVTRHSEKASGSYVEMDVNYSVTHQAVFSITQIVRDEGEALQQAEKVAARAVTKEVYGPLFDELFEVMIGLREDGYDGEALMKLEGVLTALKS